MDYYVVDKYENQDDSHEIHKVTCYHLPFWWNQVDLDQQDDTDSAQHRKKNGISSNRLSILLRKTKATIVQKRRKGFIR